jgi:hypothetical protein
MTDEKEQYGRSPMMDALPAIKAYNALPLEERIKLAREHVERQMLLRQIEKLLEL